MEKGGGQGKGGGRPGWWPEGEDWPPRAGWGQGRRRFLRRVGCFAALALFLFFTLGSLISWIFFGQSDYGSQGEGPPFGPNGTDDGPSFGFFVILLLGAGVFLLVRTVRRAARPIGDVMAAADRVAAGDYAARVEARAGGEVGRLVGSFNEMATRLQATEEQRRNLLADVAHELRTPLAVIQGTVEGMLDGVYGRDDARLGAVLEETEVMARLLEDLRTLATAEAGVLRLHREETDAAELVDDVVAAFGPRAAGMGVRLSRRVGVVPELDIDPVRVRQVLENLVTNALRHTPRGGTVRIEALRDGLGVVFSVADSGAGIPPEALPHVFDRFWKSADSGGSGLGLAIAKGLVEAHGGEILAESKVGQGTTVRFILPIRRPVRALE